MRKKQKNEKKIIDALDALSASIRNLQKFGHTYDTYIDDAALRGDDARARQLIKQKLRVYALAERLQVLKGNIELGAYTSRAMSELGKLPAAISGCKGLLLESPDFTKLTKSITSIFSDINKSEAELAKLNDIINPLPSTDSFSSRLDGVAEDENSEAFLAEYEKLMIRIKSKIASDMVTIPDDDPNDTDPNDTGSIDYVGVFDEENKRK